MSVCVNIRTEKQIEPCQIFNSLVDLGEAIMVTSDEFPSLKFGNFNTSLRGIEVNKEDNGFEVRICTYASFSDYTLFGKTIKIIMDLTGDKAFMEDCDDEPVLDPINQFNKEWITKSMESDFMCCKALTRHSGQPIVMFGLFNPFVVGPLLYWRFSITYTNPFHRLHLEEMQDCLIESQWKYKDSIDTSTNMVIPTPEKDSYKSISSIVIKDGKVCDFDVITFADFLMISDLDNNDSVIIPFKQLWKIIPATNFIDLMIINLRE